MERLNLSDLRVLFLSGFKASFKKLVILFIVSSVVVHSLILTRDPVYKTSWTLLLPGTERSSTVNLDNIGEAMTTTRNAYGNISLSPKHTYREIALSEAVLGKAAKKYGVEIYAFTKPKLQLVQQTPAIRFSLKGANQESLIKRAKVFNEAFHETLDELRASEIERHERGVQNQMQRVKNRLLEAQDRIVKFKSNALLISSNQLPLKVEALENLKAKSIESDIELARMESTLMHASNALKITAEQAAALLPIVNFPENKVLIEQYGELSSEMTILAATFGPEYPKRKIVQEQLSAVSTKLLNNKATSSVLADLSSTEFLAFLTDGARRNLSSLVDDWLKKEGLGAQQQRYQQELTQLNQSLREYSDDVAKLDSLERDFQIAEAIFSSALARLDSGKFDIYATYPLTQLLTQPGMNVTRDHLVIKLIIVSAFLIAVILGLMILLLEMRQIYFNANKAESYV